MTMRRLALALLLLLPAAAAAQLSPAAKLSEVAANQLGILEYCHDTGHAGADAVAAEREAFLGAPSTRLSTVPAEELGRHGFSVAPDGGQVPIAAVATAQNTTVPALCADLAGASLQFQAAVHKRAGHLQPPNGLPAGAAPAP